MYFAPRDASLEIAIMTLYPELFDRPLPFEQRGGKSLTKLDRG